MTAISLMLHGYGTWTWNPDLETKGGRWSGGNWNLGLRQMQINRISLKVSIERKEAWHWRWWTSISDAPISLFLKGLFKDHWIPLCFNSFWSNPLWCDTPLETLIRRVPVQVIPFSITNIHSASDSKFLTSQNIQNKMEEKTTIVHYEGHKILLH